jgi:hypothetical protein
MWQGNKRYNVVIASSEVSPYSKSGGLADVAAKLSVALSQLGHRVMTVAPSYRCLPLCPAANAPSMSAPGTGAQGSFAPQAPRPNRQ